MWIRLESCHKGKDPVGVYQDFDYEILNDFCNQVLLLPVPQELIEDDEGCSPTFWFTEYGWNKYGRFFEGLFEPEAQNDNATILISIIESPEKFHPYYADEYQVALCYEEAINITSEPKWTVNSLENWKQFERELTTLMMH